MHFLTKTFVVIAAMLSVALSTLVIAYAVNTDRILANYTSLQAVSAAQDAKIAELQSKLSSGQIGDRATVEQLNRDLANREAELRDLQQAKAQPVWSTPLPPPLIAG